MGSVGDLAGQAAESNPFAGAATFFHRYHISWQHFFVISPEIINELSVEKKGAWKSLNLEQVSSSIDIANFASSPHFFRAGFSFKRSFQSCLLNLHFPHCVRWSLPIGKQVWPTLRDPFSTSRWSSSSQSSMRSSPSRWSRFQNVLQANYPQDVFQVKLDRRPLSWSWLKQPKLPTRFFRHHH